MEMRKKIKNKRQLQILIILLVHMNPVQHIWIDLQYFVKRTTVWQKYKKEKKYYEPNETRGK